MFKFKASSQRKESVCQKLLKIEQTSDKQLFQSSTCQQFSLPTNNVKSCRAVMEQAIPSCQMSMCLLLVRKYQFSNLPLGYARKRFIKTEIINTNAISSTVQVFRNSIPINLGPQSLQLYFSDQCRCCHLATERTHWLSINILTTYLK